ncbi:unnamed protein product [Ectocarpus sp. 8 AP-2014]
MLPLLCPTDICPTAGAPAPTPAPVPVSADGTASTSAAPPLELLMSSAQHLPVLLTLLLLTLVPASLSPPACFPSSTSMAPSSFSSISPFPATVAAARRYARDTPPAPPEIVISSAPGDFALASLIQSSLSTCCGF